MQAIVVAGEPAAAPEGATSRDAARGARNLERAPVPVADAEERDASQR